MRIGVIGGGQLGRYLVKAAQKQGHHTVVLENDAQCPASFYADEMIVADYSEEAAQKKLADSTDYICYEFENISAAVIDRIVELGGTVLQGSDILRISQHRVREKDAIVQAGLFTAPYQGIVLQGDESELPIDMEFPFLLKTCRGGYDGKGQYLIKNMRDAADFLSHHPKGEYIAEKRISFQMELSCIVVRDVFGNAVCFDPIENIHENGILHLSISPARIRTEIKEKAMSAALQLIDRWNVTGIVAVEMFLDENDNVLINEIAPRPHNSGHLTMDAHDHSQYDLTIRAITAQRILPPHQEQNAVMVNLLGQHLAFASRQILPAGTKRYLYGKRDVKHDRKMGHVTFVGDDLDEMIDRAQRMTNIEGGLA